jgi:fructosamine-3-kinase
MEQDLDIIQQECAFENRPTFIRRLSGGDINEVALIGEGQNCWVVKKNDLQGLPQMLGKEANALVFLAKHSPLRYPRVLRHFETSKSQFLIIDYVEREEPSIQAHQNLGKGLANQHQVSADYYGWDESNYIGSLPQLNTKSTEWAEFYTEQRLIPLVKRAFDHRLVNRTFIRKMDRYYLQLSGIFPDEQPALLHGDLWGGNYFIAGDHQPLLYDPAIYFGHREMDIAMTRLFGGFSETFYTAYLAEYSLEKGWENRIPHAQLYPNLVHLNLFGSAYLGAITEVIN